MTAARPGTRWEQIARATMGADYAEQYADRFRRLADEGDDVHGEARLVVRLLAPPASVLDAGCGTGRVAVRLAELGYRVVGTDVDEAMLAAARRAAPALDWRHADLAGFDLGRRFDLVLVAGNTVPLLEPGSLDAAATCLAAHLAPGGRLVCGFGLDADHLPGDCPVTPLAEVDAAFARAGLTPSARFATWDGVPYDTTSGYVVTVHVGAA